MVRPAYEENSLSVYIGDCAQLLPLLNLKADLILTSPPYDSLREYGGHPFDFQAVAQACADALSPGGVLVWVAGDGIADGARTGTSMRQALHFMNLGLKLHDHMVYQRLGLFNRTHVRYCPAWDHMFVLSNGRPKTVNLLEDRPNATAGRRTINYNNGFGRRPDGTPITPSNNPRSPTITPTHGVRTNVWPYPVGGNGNQTGDPSTPNLHPAPFPLALARDHILTWTNPDDLVLDPMLGSGTTLRAAKDLGRRSLGIEIHPPYLSIITAKLAQQVLALNTIFRDTPSGDER